MSTISDEAFATFVATRSTRLLRMALLLTGDRGLAEDLVQDALAATFVRLGRLADEAVLETYVRTAITRTFISWSRRPFWRREHLVPDQPDDRTTTSETDIVDDRAALWPAVLALPAQQRAVIVLRFYDDLSEKQIAEILGCSTGTVKSHAHRALSRLNEIIQDGVVSAAPHQSNPLSTDRKGGATP